MGAPFIPKAHEHRLFGREHKPDARNLNFSISKQLSVTGDILLPTKPKVWTTSSPEDQGYTPHCVGYAGHHLLRSRPHYDTLKLLNAEHITGDEIYYDCKILDGEAGQEDGSNANSLMKVLRSEGFIASWNWANTEGEIAHWLGFQGPLLFGMPWHTGMDEPDKAGKVDIQGEVRGGHEWLANGFFPDTYNILDSWIKCLNSWGKYYGINGRFYIKMRSVMALLEEGGDICAPVKAS